MPEPQMESDESLARRRKIIHVVGIAILPVMVTVTNWISPIPEAHPTASSSVSTPASTLPGISRSAPVTHSAPATSPSRAKPAQAKPARPVKATAGRQLTAYLTGYSWQDNTPAGSPEISHPRVHQTAGGTGTWADPITVAVGHSMASGSDVLDWPAGTRFYLPTLERYGIVEDTCGDGPQPELGACHKHSSGVDTHLDVWIGGEGGTEAATDACMERLTGEVQVVVGPARGLPVRTGAVFSRGRCDLPG